MYASPLPPSAGFDVAASFWPDLRRRHLDTGAARFSPRAAADLFDLFVHELSLLVSGACQTDRLARTVFVVLGPEQAGMRPLVCGLARSARGCLPALPAVLSAEGVVLLPVHDRVTEALLRPIAPGARLRIAGEPAGVAAARMVGAFRHAALRFATEAARTAEDARLLGSDRLCQTLRRWAAMWRTFLRKLGGQETSFRAQAYAANFQSHQKQ